MQVHLCYLTLAVQQGACFCLSFLSPNSRLSTKLNPRVIFFAVDVLTNEIRFSQPTFRHYGPYVRSVGVSIRTTHCETGNFSTRKKPDPERLWASKCSLLQSVYCSCSNTSLDV